MNSVGKLADLDVVFALLPGLLTYLVVRVCSTGREKKIDVTEAILHGLAYTLLAHALWAICTSVGSAIPTPDIVGLSLCAVFIGVVMSTSLNHRLAYTALRKIGLTRQPEYPSIWETAFQVSQHEVGEYVVIELDDRRRLLGAIRGVSQDQKVGHICLQSCKWLPTKAGGDSVQIDGWFLVPASRIQSVQFLPRVKVDDKQRPSSSSTA